MIATGSQTIGPFFTFALDHPEWADLTSGGALGERIRVSGRVLDGAGDPVPDALIELWQANAAGRYAHPEDHQDRPLDPGFRGFGRCCTDGDGRFGFVTIRPGAVPGRGNALQAPHIMVSVFARGLLARLVTRLYFDGDPANEADPVLSSIDDPAVRRTLLAVKAGEAWRFDIVLQGEGETAFLEI